MIDRELKIGDHVFNLKGDIGTVAKINKETYTLEVDGKQYSYNATVYFNGKDRNGYGEWFYCDDAQQKALEEALSWKKKYEELKAETDSLTKETLPQIRNLLKEILMELEEEQ